MVAFAKVVHHSALGVFSTIIVGDGMNKLARANVADEVHGEMSLVDVELMASNVRRIMAREPKHLKATRGLAGVGPFIVAVGNI